MQYIPNMTKKNEKTQPKDTELGKCPADQYSRENDAAREWASIGSSDAGVDKSPSWPLSQGDATESSKGGDNSAAVTSKLRVGRPVRQGRSAQTARETAEILREVHEGSCTDSERQELWDRFVGANAKSTRGALISEIRGALEKRGFSSARARLAAMVRRHDSEWTSTVDAIVISLLGQWFTDPKLVGQYDPSRETLLSTYRRWDILKEVELLLVLGLPESAETDDELHEDDWERLVFGGTTNRPEPTEVDTLPEFEGDLAPNESAAILLAADDLISGIANGDSEFATSFIQLEEALQHLVETRKLKPRDREIFVVGMCHNSTVAAEVAKVTPNNARQVCSRTRQKLRDYCNGHGDTAAPLKSLLDGLTDRTS